MITASHHYVLFEPNLSPYYILQAGSTTLSLVYSNVSSLFIELSVSPAVLTLPSNYICVWMTCLLPSPSTPFPSRIFSGSRMSILAYLNLASPLYLTFLPRSFLIFVLRRARCMTPPSNDLMHLFSISRISSLLSGYNFHPLL